MPKYRARLDSQTAIEGEYLYLVEKKGLIFWNFLGYAYAKTASEAIAKLKKNQWFYDK